MVREEVGETVLAQPLAHEPLEDVHVGVAVALDENWAVVQDRDVPADHHAIGELAVGPDR